MSEYLQKGGFWNAIVSANVKSDFFLSNTAVLTEENNKMDDLISVVVDSVAEHFLQYSFTTSEEWGKVMDTYIYKEFNTLVGVLGEGTTLAIKNN